MHPKDSEADRRNRRLMIDTVNSLGQIVCTDCGHPFGYSTAIWECQNDFHLRAEAFIHDTGDKLGLLRCVRCGHLEEPGLERMVLEPGHMLYSQYNPPGSLPFCYPCWHVSFDTSH